MKYDYFWYNGVYTPEQCDELARLLQEDSKKCQAADNPAKGTIKTATVKPVAWEHCKHYLGKLDQLMKYTNLTQFGLHLYDMTDSECVNYNEYSEEKLGQYEWHSDGTKDGDVYDIKMTTILNLSTEPYEGGRLELFLNGERHIQELDRPGAVLCFPSWVQHRVTPVTKGIRKTLSIWTRGPNFR